MKKNQKYFDLMHKKSPDFSELLYFVREFNYSETLLFITNLKPSP